MKKSLVLIVCFWMAISLFGFEKGTMSVGGSIGVESSKYSDESKSIYSFWISPEFSYFIPKNLCLDVSPGFGVSWAESESTYTGLAIDFGARYFYKNFYGGASYRYGKSGTKGNKGSSQDITLKIGHLWEIAKHIYLDTGIVYNHGLGDVKYSNPVYNFKNDGSSISLRTGVQVFFKK